MIATDFAANESWDDAFASLAALFQPDKWITGTETNTAKEALIGLFPSIKQPLSAHCYLTGRAAIHAYIRALELPLQTDVLIQAFTCEAVPLPIIDNTFNPIYVDIEQETFSMDIHDLKKKITPNARVLILQHTFGFTPKNRQQILEFAEKNNLTVLEDLAHGFNPDILSSTNNTTTLLLSFGRSKAFSSVFGGAILTNDQVLRERLEKNEPVLPLASNGFIIRSLLYKPFAMLIKSTYDIIIGKIFHKLFTAFDLLIPEITNKEKNGHYDDIFAKKYPNALALLLLHQLQKYPFQIQQRFKLAVQYNRYCKEHNLTSYDESTLKYLSRFPILVENRDQLLHSAAKKNVFLGKWYDQVVAPKKLQLEKVKYIPDSCPVAQKTSENIINVPLNISHIDQVTSILS